MDERKGKGGFEGGRRKEGSKGKQSGNERFLKN